MFGSPLQRPGADIVKSKCRWPLKGWYLTGWDWAHKEVMELLSHNFYCFDINIDEYFIKTEHSYARRALSWLALNLPWALSPQWGDLLYSNRLSSPAGQGLKLQKHDLRLIWAQLCRKDKQKDYQSLFTILVKCPAMRVGGEGRASESNQNRAGKHYDHFHKIVRTWMPLPTSRSYSDRHASFLAWKCSRLSSPGPSPDPWCAVN